MEVLRLLNILTKQKVAAQISNGPWTQTRARVGDYKRALIKVCKKRLLSKLTKRALKKAYKKPPIGA